MIRLHIKNMVCPRCIEAVRNFLIDLNIPFSEVRLGEVDLKVEQIENMDEIKSGLNKLGFELLEDKKTQIVEQIKNIIIQEIHHSDQKIQKQNFSDIISKDVGRDYSYLSNLFSSTQNITIEKYIIKQKIEKVKELLIYDELNLSEITYKLDYSSPAHLSRQFKNETGLTPTEFKSLRKNARKPLDNV